MKILHRDKNKKKRDYTLRKIREKHGFWFWVLFFLIILFALNVATMQVSMLGSLLYQLEIMTISFLRTPVRAQLWFTFLILFIAAILGYVFTPVLTIPSTGEWFIILRKKREGDLITFYTTSGKKIQTVEDNTRRFMLHWFIYKDVSPSYDPVSGAVFYESVNLEVTQYVALERKLDMLANQVAELEETLAIRETELIDKIKQLQGESGGEE